MQQQVRAEAVETNAVPRWSWVLVAVLLFGVYLMTMDNGLVLARAAETAHEFFHDARHFLGVPCH
jgi:hypothetical protein